MVLKELIQKAQIEYKSAKSFLEAKDFANAKKHYESFNNEVARLSQIDTERKNYNEILKSLVEQKEITEEKDFAKYTSLILLKQAKEQWRSAGLLANQQNFVKAKAQLLKYAESFKTLVKQNAVGTEFNNSFAQVEKADELLKNGFLNEDQSMTLKTAYEAILSSSKSQDYEKGLEQIAAYQLLLDSAQKNYKEALVYEKKLKGLESVKS